MDKIRGALAEFAERFQEHATAFLTIPLLPMLVLELLVLMRQKLFSWFSILLEFTCVVCILLFYQMFAGTIPEKTKQLAVRRFKAGCCIFLFFLSSNSMLWVQKMLGTTSLTVPAMIAGLFSELLFIAFCSSETGKKKFTRLRNIEDMAPKLQKKRLNPGDVVLCNIKDELEAGAKDPREIIPYKDRFLHTLIIGVTGTGKTSQSLIPLIQQDIQNNDVGVIVLEPKGDLAQKIKMMSEYYGRPAKYFDVSMDTCPHFNPLAGRELDVVENMSTTFRMLNPDSPTFFLDLNEQLIRNAIKVLKRLDKDDGIDGKNATLINLSRLLQNSGGQGRELIQRFSGIAVRTDSEAKENADISSWFLNDYFVERSKIYENTSGVRSQVAKICSNEFLREVLNPNVMEGEHNDIDFDKALADGEVICISTAQGVLRGLSRFLGYFLILQLQSAVFRRPGNENTRRACFLYIDEFQTYSNPGFGDMLTMGRSYRVASHLATQARSQMSMGAGRDGRDFVNLVSSNARNVIIYPGCSYDDAKFYSNQFGETEKIETMVGVSRKRFNLITGGLAPLGHPTESVREQKKMAANFSPTDLIYRPFGEITYSIVKHNTLQPARVGKITYIDQELNKELDRRIEEYDSIHKRKTEDELFEERRKKANGGMEWENGEDFCEGMELTDPMNGEEEPVKAETAPDNLYSEVIEAAAKEERPTTAKDALHEAIIQDQLFQDEGSSQPIDFDALDDYGDPEDGLDEESYPSDNFGMG